MEAGDQLAPPGSKTARKTRVGAASGAGGRATGLPHRGAARSLSTHAGRRAQPLLF